MQFAGAIFDVDGVLVDSPHEPAWRQALDRLMAGAWRDLAAQTGYAPERFTTEVYQVHVAGKPREAGARAALAHFGVHDPDGARARAYSAAKQERLLELAERGEFAAFDDALRFLLALKEQGVKLAAASSSHNANLFLSRVAVGLFCARHGLRYAFVGPGTTLLDLFDTNLCGRDAGPGKPDPAIFLAAAAELGLPPADCLVVEDAPAGVQAAKAAGMTCIGVARLNDAGLLAAAGADMVVTSLDHVGAQRTASEV